MSDIRKACVEAIFRGFEDEGDAIRPAYAGGGTTSKQGVRSVTSSDTSTSTWPASWTSSSTPSTRS